MNLLVRFIVVFTLQLYIFVIKCCENIKISIFNTANKLTLILKDDGNGFDVQDIKNRGIGLRNMKKRVEMIKGDFNIESDEFMGTMLTVEIPV